MEIDQKIKRNAVLIGALVGALIGVVAANSLVREAEENDGELAITPAKGFQLGILVLGLLRQISSL